MCVYGPHSTFHRGGTIVAGDDVDMERHMVTIEEPTVAHTTDSIDQQLTLGSASAVPSRISLPTPSVVGSTTASTSTSTSTSLSSSANTLASTNGSVKQPITDTQFDSGATVQQQAKRKKWRPPQPITSILSSTTINRSLNKVGQDAQDHQDVQGTFLGSMTGPLQAYPTLDTTPTTTATSKPISATSVPTQASKRRKVGLSRMSGVLGFPVQSSVSNRTPSTQLEFPNAARCTNFTGKNSTQLLRRSLALGSRFASTNQYKDGMAYLIYEHLQIMVIEIAIAMWSIKTGSNVQEAESLDALYRSRGIPMHSLSTLRRRGDVYVGFPVFSERGFNGIENGTGTMVQPSSLQGLTLTISNKEHHSKYVHVVIFVCWKRRM